MHDDFALMADPGIDDAVALAVLAGLGAPPSLVVAMPGNVDGATATRNAAGLVRLLGLSSPVRSFLADAPASARPGRGRPHGDDGLGGVAARLPLVAVPPALSFDELPQRVLVTGALTCAAAAIERDCPIEQVTWMGGALASGNVTAHAEFNAWCDPHALNVVAVAPASLGIVPLDVTERVALDHDDLDRLTIGRAGSVLAEGLRSRTTAVVHDAVAAVAWLRPDLFGWDDLVVRCATTEPERGRLKVHGAGSTRVAVRVEADAVRRVIVDAVLACG